MIGSIQMFEANLLDNLNALMRELKTRGTFQPCMRRVFIPKGKGKMRPLGIPAVTELHRRCCDSFCRESMNLYFMRIRLGSVPNTTVIWR